MSNKVYANGRELACKAGMGKSIAGFPDVCLSPPSPPAGPIPIPYPVTGVDDDTTGGSKHVKITDAEVMLKNQSSFKKCTGDEAATKSFGMSVVTHNITGPVYFCVWSMDVKIEGENAVRHLDMVTHNHMCEPGSPPPWTFAKRASIAGQSHECDQVVKDAETACDPWKDEAKCPSTKGIKKARGAMAKAKKAWEKAGKASKVLAKNDWDKKIAELNSEYDSYAEGIAKSECHKKLRCLLSPWKPSRCCPSGQTPHHLVEKASFFKKKYGGSKMTGCASYNASKAACVCVEGNSQYVATHGIAHTVGGTSLMKKADGNGEVSFQQACNSSKDTMSEVFKKSGCPEPCIEAQLKKSHEDMAKKGQKKIDGSTRIKAVAEGDVGDAETKAALKKAAAIGVG
ncbi:MAG TPA: PAAR-like domain-containing protein [Planctomycetota bacterium]|nr:PAAR-like domain-containing protein [Planctomycetota bacterium]